MCKDLDHATSLLGRVCYDSMCGDYVTPERVERFLYHAVSLSRVAWTEDYWPADVLCIGVETDLGIRNSLDLEILGPVETISLQDIPEGQPGGLYS